MRDAPLTAAQAVGNLLRPAPMPSRAVRRQMLKRAGALGDRGYDVRRTKAEARRKARK